MSFLAHFADVNTGLGFIFINGSMQADVQCCIQALQEWENTVGALGGCLPHSFKYIDTFIMYMCTYGIVGKKLSKPHIGVLKKR